MTDDVAEEEDESVERLLLGRGGDLPHGFERRRAQLTVQRPRSQRGASEGEGPDG